MQVFRSLEAYQPAAHTIATIGTFDGLHLGHQYILQHIIDEARQANGTSLLISFHPHPRMVLQPDNPSLHLLHTLEEKIAMLESMGLDRLLLIPFTKAFSTLSSQAYIEDVLVKVVQAKRVVIGYDHRFGHDRQGNIDTLRTYQTQHDFEVEEIPAQLIQDAKISSTAIRKALEGGKVAEARTLLGYPYSFGGTVIHGEKLGRTIGYPTANIQPESPLKLIPSNGVYFVKVMVKGISYYGMMSVGNKPTVGTFERGCEVYIFEFDADIYGEYVRTDFLEYIRPEQKFDSLDALIKAIDGDRDYCLAQIALLENQA